jgi:uncharacterized membrane protein
VIARLEGRWVGWVLIVSLALNLFLVGVVGVRYWREHVRPPPDRVAMGPFGRLTQGLPESGRAKFKEAMDSRREQMREQGREFRRARGEAMQALAAEPFDRVKVDAAFAEARRRADTMSAIMQGAMIEASAQLTSDERKAFRDRLAERERERERRGPPRN